VGARGIYDEKVWNMNVRKATENGTGCDRIGAVHELCVCDLDASRRQVSRLMDVAEDSQAYELFSCCPVSRQHNSKAQKRKPPESVDDL